MEMESIYPQVGQKMRQLRMERRLSQNDLAQAIGLSRTSVVNIEQGRQKILLHTLYDIADVFEVPVTDLLPTHADSEERMLADPLAQSDPSIREFFYALQKMAQKEEE